MCGIIACLGPNTHQILFEGLQQLQNRGYDSAGVCSIQENKFIINKYSSDGTTAIHKLKPCIELYEKLFQYFVFKINKYLDNNRRLKIFCFP